MLNGLLKILTSRLFWGFIGITFIALIVWFAGPYLAFNNYFPLESATNRVITIAIIYSIWILFKIIPKLYSIWFNNKLLKQLSQTHQEEGASISPAAMEEDELLRSRFTEALELLKKANFNRTDGSKARWYDRFSNQHVYQLPWYVIIGAPGAGKTTALVNSGLHFPLAEHYGKAALRGVGGTSNCDWWFTNEAVLLDTAGRYTTQESQQEEDAIEWRNFIKLLKTYRPRQPINGIILTISVYDLLSYSPEARTLQAIMLRKRLAELYKEFNIYFPVYVLVTKMDLLNGFLAYFNHYDKSMRSQIWGFTFLHSLTQQSDFNLLRAFDQEYDGLQQRIDAAVMSTMQNEIDIKKRADIYQFPQQFALLKDVLHQYLADVFPSSAFEKSISPRGVYFTSGTQGMAYDQLMNAVKSALHKPEDINDFQQQEAANANTTQGQSYFLKDLLQKVITKEAGLAGNSRWWEYRNRALHWAGYITLTVVAVTSTLLWFNSYQNNKDYLEEVNAKFSNLDYQVKSLHEGKSIAAGKITDSVLPLLNTLHSLAESSKFEVNDPPLTYQLGLFRGTRISEVAEMKYTEALRTQLLPHITLLTKELLATDDQSDPDYTHDALKAYLMFYQPEHYDGQFLHSWIMQNLKKILPVELSINTQRQISAHLTNLLVSGCQSKTNPDKACRATFEQDNNITERAKIYLNQTDLAVRVYSRIKRTLLKQDNLPEITLNELGGPLSDSVFKRRSGKSNNTGVSGLFSSQGYWNVFNKNISEITDILYQESSWMLDKGYQSRENSEQLYQKVRQLYVSDYKKNWDEFLADIDFVELNSLDEYISFTREMSGPYSPLRTLAINLAEATTLYELPAAGTDNALVSTFKDNIVSKHSRLNTAVNTVNSVRSARDQQQAFSPELEIERHYETLHRLAEVNSENKNSIPFDSNIKILDQLYTHLIAVSSSIKSNMPIPETRVLTEIASTGGRLPTPFNNLFTSLLKSAQVFLGNSNTDVTFVAIQNELGSMCNQTIVNHYPLNMRSRVDVTPDDLATYFAPQTGKFDQLFQQYFRGKVDTSQAVWKINESAYGGHLTTERLNKMNATVRMFQQASKIRSALFAGNSPTPSFRIALRPIYLDSKILSMTLDINGQVLHYSHGPIRTVIVEWPGNNNSNQVDLQFSLTNGSTSNYTTEGFWALHKMFNKGIITSSSGANDKLIVTFNLNGSKTVLEVSPYTTVNPFKLPELSCP